MKRFVLSLLAVAAIVVGLWVAGDAAGVELALVPSLIVALVLTSVLHLATNRRRWRS